jgi:hypothetical protein
MQQHRRWLDMRGGFGIGPKLQRDGRRRRRRGAQHRAAKAQLHEAVDVAAQDAFDLRVPRHHRG